MTSLNSTNMAIFGWLLFKQVSFQSAFFMILILGGAVSNLFDRIRFGCVVDFIDFRIWPVFNVADIGITLGTLMLLVRWKKI